MILTAKKWKFRKDEIGGFTYGSPLILGRDDGAKFKIGSFCSIAEGVTLILGRNHRPDWTTTYPFSVVFKEFNHIKGHPQSKGDIIIGSDVWIGWNATILSGVTIGDGAVIGANATVAKSVFTSIFKSVNSRIPSLPTKP